MDDQETKPTDISEVASREEKEPHTSVLFFGYIHDPLNLQVLDKLDTSLEGAFAKDTMSKMMFLELTAATPDQAAFIAKQAKESGLQQFVITMSLLQELGRNPTPNEIQDKMRVLSDKTVDDILEQRLLNGQSIQTYFTAGLFDKALRAHPDVALVIESHSSEKVAQIENLKSRIAEIEDQSWQAWSERRFTDVVDLRKQYYDLSYESAVLREKDVVDVLHPVVDATPDIGLFVSFGALHESMMHQIKKDFVASTSLPQGYPPGEIMQRLRKGETPTSDLYAKEFLYDLLFTYTRETCKQNRYADYFAKRFEDINQIVIQVVQAEDITSIEAMCATPENFNQVYEKIIDTIITQLE